MEKGESTTLISFDRSLVSFTNQQSNCVSEKSFVGWKWC